jgi:hypothetical protein
LVKLTLSGLSSTAPKGSSIVTALDSSVLMLSSARDGSTS